MPGKPAAKPAGKQSKAAKKAEELARKQEEDRLAALIEEERLQREQIEREDELKRLADEKKLVDTCFRILQVPFNHALTNYFYQWLEQEGRRLADEKLDLEPLFSDRARLAILEQKK